VRLRRLRQLAAGLALALPLAGWAQTPSIGVAVMHGKGGSPARYVSELAVALEEKGCLVANLEMPWSGARGYDADSAAAEAQLGSAIDGLRAKGARKLFVAGHSQGGVFALWYGSRHAVDGVIAIAPGGNVNSPIYREKIGDSLARAHRLVAEGKGAEKAPLTDFEGGRGVYPVLVAPAAYLSWFEAGGAMDELAAIRSMKPEVPVLFISPTADYASLARIKQLMFGALPRNPLTRLYEPVSDHLGAPSASREEILRWTAEVAAKP